MAVMQGVNKQIKDQAKNDAIQSLIAKIQSGKLSKDSASVETELQNLFREKSTAAMKRVWGKESVSIHRVIDGLRFEAVLNKQQF